MIGAELSPLRTFHTGWVNHWSHPAEWRHLITEVWTVILSYFLVVDPPKKLLPIIVFPQKDPAPRCDDIIYEQPLKLKEEQKCLKHLNIEKHFLWWIYQLFREGLWLLQGPAVAAKSFFCVFLKTVSRHANFPKLWKVFEMYYN